MPKFKIQKGLIFSLFVLSVSLMFMNIQGMLSVQPVQIEVSETKEVLLDSNSFVVCMHVTNNFVYVMIPGIYNSFKHNMSTIFSAKGDYAEIYNADGYISKAPTVDFINVTMWLNLPDNWTCLIIYREDRVSTTEEPEITGIRPGHINGSFDYLFSIYHFNGSKLATSIPINHHFTIGPVSIIDDSFYEFTIAYNNATKFGLIPSESVKIALNFIIGNITMGPSEFKYNNFSVWFDFGLGYTLYKNITLTKSYTQYPDITQYLFFNLGSLVFISAVVLISLAFQMEEAKKE